MNSILRFVVATADISLTSWANYDQKNDILIELNGEQLIIPYAPGIWDKLLAVMTPERKMSIFNKLIKNMPITNAIGAALGISTDAIIGKLIEQDNPDFLTRDSKVARAEQLLMIVRHNAILCWLALKPAQDDITDDLIREMVLSARDTMIKYCDDAKMDMSLAILLGSPLASPLGYPLASPLGAQLSPRPLTRVCTCKVDKNNCGQRLQGLLQAGYTIADYSEVISCPHIMLKHLRMLNSTGISDKLTLALKRGFIIEGDKINQYVLEGDCETFSTLLKKAKTPPSIISTIVDEMIRAGIPEMDNAAAFAQEREAHSPRVLALMKKHQGLSECNEMIITHSCQLAKEHKYDEMRKLNRYHLLRFGCNTLITAIDERDLELMTLIRSQYGNYSIFHVYEEKVKVYCYRKSVQYISDVMSVLVAKNKIADIKFCIGNGLMPASADVSKCFELKHMTMMEMIVNARNDLESYIRAGMVDKIVIKSGVTDRHVEIAMDHAHYSEQHREIMCLMIGAMKSYPRALLLYAINKKNAEAVAIMVKKFNITRCENKVYSRIFLSGEVKLLDAVPGVQAMIKSSNDRANSYLLNAVKSESVAMVKFILPYSKANKKCLEVAGNNNALVLALLGLDSNATATEVLEAMRKI